MKGTITKYRKRNGRISWGYYYKRDGQQFSKSGFGTKFEASKALGAALANREDRSSSICRDEGRTVADYIGYWLDNHAALRCQPKTLERYRQLSDYLIRLLGGIQILALTPAAIQEAVNALLLRGGAPTKAHPGGRPLAAKTVHSTGSLLYTCLADASRLAHVPANPMADGKVKLPRRPAPTPAVLDAGALGAIFQVAKGTRIYPFLVVAASSGCRLGELLALTWADLDFKTGLLTISKSLEQTRAGLRTKGTKSGRSRTIWLDSFALQVLANLLEEQKRDRTERESAYRANNLIFCQPNGDFYSPDHMGTRTKALLRKAGYPSFSLHSLRHSHATILLRNGTPLAVVSERLGHASQNMTLSVYSHCLPADRGVAARVWQTALAEVMSVDGIGGIAEVGHATGESDERSSQNHAR